ncbi:hypothetical protein RB597_005685 [Gaeumannomyces tritici]
MASQPSDENDPWSAKHKQKLRSEWYDPCREAASESVQCLNRNGGNGTMCREYFRAYRDCEKNWTTRRRNERARTRVRLVLDLASLLASLTRRDPLRTIRVYVPAGFARTCSGGREPKPALVILCVRYVRYVVASPHITPSGAEHLC